MKLLAAPSQSIRSLPRKANGRLILTVTGREAIPDLVVLLVSQGIRVYRLAARDPSLEDVYFALHGEVEVLQRTGV
jgi:hypothetical protein